MVYENEDPVSKWLLYNVGKGSLEGTVKYGMDGAEFKDEKRSYSYSSQ